MEPLPAKRLSRVYGEKDRFMPATGEFPDFLKASTRSGWVRSLAPTRSRRPVTAFHSVHLAPPVRPEPARPPRHGERSLNQARRGVPALAKVRMTCVLSLDLLEAQGS